MTCPDPDAEELFRMVGEVFIFWSKSHVSWPLQTKVNRYSIPEGDCFVVQVQILTGNNPKVKNCRFISPVRSHFLVYVI